MDEDGDGFLSQEELHAVIAGNDGHCGCCRRTTDMKGSLRHYLGDWRLVGLNLLLLCVFVRK